jgi:hypothetical protein
MKDMLGKNVEEIGRKKGAFIVDVDSFSIAHTSSRTSLKY